MPTAESEETMHLFIDFLAEGGFVRLCVRVRGVSVCLCAWAHAPIYDRDTLEGSKRNVIQPRRHTGTVRKRGRARQQA